MSRSDTPIWSSLSLSLVLLGSPSFGADFDPSPAILSASEVLGADVLRGEHHEVMERVENDGYMNSYRIASDFGRFEAYGNPQLAIRVLEIGALAELDQLSKSEVFAEAAKSSALSSVDTIEQFAEKPVETMKGVPSGAKRMFKVARRKAGDLYDAAEEEYEERKAEREAEEEGGGEGDGGVDAEELADDAADAGSYLVKRYFGISSAERRWAQKLGVDPYTSNEALRQEIKEVARVDSAGRFGVKLLPIPSIPGVSVLRTVNSVVWSKDPYELQDFNRARMEAMGASSELIDAFFEVPWMSPTGQTFFITALESLAEAENRPRAIEQALGLESVDEARFMVEAAQMLAWLNAREAPIARLLRGERTLVALTGDGREMIPLPVDRLSWTREVAEMVTRRTPELTVAGVDSLELWLARDVSPLAKRELEDLGWRVETELVERMRKDPLASDDEQPGSAP